MSMILSRLALEERYAEAAREYEASLPPEHYMEATPQATQREITVESFALVRRARPDFHYFNELLVQYPYGPEEKIRQVVPDNMVVLYPGEVRAEGSFNLPMQEARPTLVLEYVSKGSRRKDYEESFQKYERELKVPYYLTFYPDTQDLTLFRLGVGRYVSVKPNGAERLMMPDLELEVALVEGWVRYWFRGEMLPLPAELQQSLEETRQKLHFAEEAARQAQERERLAHERERLAHERERLAREGEERQRRQAEQLLARLRELGVEPE